MKKILSAVLAVFLVFSFCSCSGRRPAADDRRLSIVTTIFPEYDWVRNILGDTAADADVTMLLDSGVDLHSYQPSADDIIRISTCDVFVYVGGESDEWVKDALKEAVNKDMIVVDLMDALGDAVKEEEVVEGMQAEKEEDSADAAEDEGPEYDEHVWLSLRNASVLVSAIEKALSSADPENTAAYQKNAAAYREKLAALDRKYVEVTNNAPVRTLLFGDRFPFRYLTEDYGLSYFAAFVGCSAESEASFETIAFLANKVDELDLPAVLTLEGSDHRIAETITTTASKNDVKILSVDSLQSVTAGDVTNGADYLRSMEENLEVFRKALTK